MTSDEYVAGKKWLEATLKCCPWHPQGGCGFSRHGTYERVKPPGTLIARWYCPKQHCTISALPDCLASHYSGTLIELEAIVLRIEQAPSLAGVAESLRPAIEPPGARRYCYRLVQSIGSALQTLRGLWPDLFECRQNLAHLNALLPSAPSVLMSLRQQAWPFLPGLPTPFGFNPSPSIAATSSPVCQHKVGHDPPQAFLDASG